MGYNWLICIAIFALVEAFTSQMVSIWFVAGSLAGLLAFLFGADTMAQFAAAVIVSAVSLVFFRKAVYNRLHIRENKTNVDALIGRELLVGEDIKNIRNEGSGKLNGIEWSLRSENGEDIPSGTKVTVKKIKGVTLIVAPVAEKKTVSV